MLTGMTTTTTLCFDLDGTLVDSYLDIATALNAALQTVGAPVFEAESVKRLIGGGVVQLLANASLKPGTEEFEQAMSVFRSSYARCLADTTGFYPGVRSLLEALRDRGIPVVVATNKPAVFTRAIARHLGFEQLGIVALASGDETPAKKPDPSVIRLAYARAALTSALTASPRPFYVGDMPVDVESARAAGMRSAIVAWGFDPRGAVALSPDAFIEDPMDLIERLARMAV
ncbi:MAG: HAD hydrolase-like protein [Deltaproteobacteria bacterium]|nr:HAD hydrolase-like protein [Deltaproteobacteria bacterium]